MEDVFFLRYQTLRRVGLFYYKTVREGTFTRLHGGGPGGGLRIFFVGEWVPNSTTGGLLLQDCRRAGTFYQTTRRSPPRGEGFESSGGKNGEVLPPSIL